MTKTVISPAYAALNRQLHDEQPDYGTAAAEWAPHVIEFARQQEVKVILDYGCGKGLLKTSLATLAPEITVLEFDPAIAGKEILPSAQPDLLVALDVMEHIEPDWLAAVLETIYGTRAKIVMLSIATSPAKKNLPDGRNAHILVKDHSWWMSTLAQYFTPIHSQVNGDHFVYIGLPK